MLLTDSGVATDLKKSLPTAVFLPRQHYYIKTKMTSARIFNKWYKKNEPIFFSTKLKERKMLPNQCYLSKLWNDVMKGLPNHGCFVIWSMRRDIFNRSIPLQICGFVTAAWRPTSPTWRPRYFNRHIAVIINLHKIWNADKSKLCLFLKKITSNEKVCIIQTEILAS